MFLGVEGKVRGVLLAITPFVAAGLSASGTFASSANVGIQAGTETTLALSKSLAPFGVPTGVVARVKPSAPAAGSAAGSVQFRVDGAKSGGPVALEDGTASRVLARLTSGDHEVIATYLGHGGLAPSRAMASQTVDSPPPGPEGILPCAHRRVVLAAVYRRDGALRFEGAARYSLRGEEVRIWSGGERLASATVQSDGTFWGNVALGARKVPGRTRFQARVAGHRSWPRRLAQAIQVVKRTPRGARRDGQRPGVAARIDTGGIHRVQLVRQVGCHKEEAIPVKQLGSEPDGSFRVAMPRPAKSRPYTIYRLRIDGGLKVSPPIVVRSAR